LPRDERLAFAGFGFRDQCLKLRIRFQQFIDEVDVFRGIQWLNCQESLVRHLDNNGLTGLGAITQRLFQVRFQLA
jgi:hypothetical protein